MIAEHLAHLRAAGRADTTVAMREYLLWRLHHHLPQGLAFAATVEIEDFLAKLREAGRKKATILAYRSAARQLFMWADAVGWIDGDPTINLAKPSRPKLKPRPCTSETLATALTAPEPWLTIYTLAYFQGLRCKEIAGAKREHVTAESTFIPDAKGGDPASVPTHPRVWELVRDRPPGYLVLSIKRREPVTAHWVSHTARAWLSRRGMPASAHRLRHRFATDLLEAGCDVRTLQELLRHATLAMTQAYAEVTSERKRAAISLLGTPAGR